MMKKQIVRLLCMVMAMMLLTMSCGLAETLRLNSSGDGVKNLQTALKQLGFYAGGVDGKYGYVTQKSVKNFQAAYGLSADGVAGNATQTKLEALTGIEITDNTPVSTPTPTPVKNGLFGGDYSKMVFGAESNRVRTLQKALLALGFDIDKVDGSFGSQTYTAVKAFQETVGLEADGVAGAKTLKKLESYFDEDGNVISGPIVTTPPPASDENLSYAEPKRTLRMGMSGLDVQYTQDRLKKLGYYTGASDGKFGSGMYAAVKAFQERNSLSVDGVIGSGTRKVLFSLGALGADESIVTNPTDRTLRLGMEGEDVKAVQTRLKLLGYYTGAEDGKYGSGTVTAVKAFQARNSLTQDGVCGEDTVRVLFSADAIDAGSSIKPTPAPVPTATPARTLKKGDQGDDVAYVQTRLKELGYYSAAVDGKYGSGTVSAVKFFQARNSLTVDGKVGAATSAKLFASNAIHAGSGSGATPTPTATPEPQTTPGRTLRIGAQGEDVVLLQVRLISLGYLTGKADGVFGAGTSAAVQAFQLRNGLSADGVAGTKTYKKLFSDSALPAAPATSAPSGSTVPTRELYSGCSGDDVKQVQTRLKTLGYLNDTVDGKYGANTTAAMKVFQQMNRLTASGRGDSATYSVLFSDKAITSTGQQVGDNSTITYTNLTIGSTGTAVIRLQQMLASLKYNVNVTGTYDDATYSAVLAFQKRNGLSADGIAGKSTQTKLYSGNCVTGDTRLPEDDSASGGTTGNGGGPAVSQVQLLHWFDDIKPTIKSGQIVLVYEPSSGSSFYLRLYSLGRHADSEPYRAEDTAIMKAAWGGSFSWKEKPVYVRLPSGVWCIASMHSMPHLSGAISNNDFDGHLCVHFPRTMTECQKNDPKNGVRHQNDIRKHWLKISGQEVPW